MARAFSTMKTNVGLEVQDTSSDMATMIGKFLNRRYFQVLRSINWQLINDDYTINVTSGTQDYELPADYGKQIACYDTTNDVNIEVRTLAELYKEYGDSVADSGAVSRAAIWMDDSGKNKIKFHYKPSSSLTVALPYIIKPTEMSADASTPLMDWGDMLECGARADCYRYKRMFAKAAAEEANFTSMLADHIWEFENQPNQITQLTPSTYNRNSLY